MLAATIAAALRTPLRRLILRMLLAALGGALLGWQNADAAILLVAWPMNTTR
jgi:hypothetical protein